MKLNYIKHFIKKSLILNKKGQSLIEYLMLMLVITSLSIVFIKAANNKLSQVWVQMIETVSDEPQSLSQNDLKR